MPSTQQLDQKAASTPLDRSRIPVFDVGALFGEDKAQRSALVEQIRAACHDPGFFYIHNTCVSDSAINAALESSREFFANPDQGPVKQGVHNRDADDDKGWGPLYGEPAYQKDTVAHMESFDIGQQLSASECAQLCIPENIWPDLAGFRSAELQYADFATKLGACLSEVISELLGVPRDFMRNNSGISTPRTMRLPHYPANSTPADDVNVGVSAHTDFECFTLMNQTAVGLELTDSQGQWRQAPSDIGTFTIILGDMTEHLSHGHFRATGHRVVNTH